MGFWKKWINVALVFVMTLSLLSPAVVQAEGKGNAQQDESSEETAAATVGNEVTSPDHARIVVVEAVSDVQKLIGELLTVEQANEETELALQTARDAYNALTVEQQALITNVNELVEKEEAFLALRVKSQLVEKTINFRVEGYKGTHLLLKDVVVTGTGEITAAEATKQILDANGIVYKYSPSIGYFSSIAGESEKALGVGSGWLYKVNGVYPDVYSKDVTIEDGDEIVWDYINSTSVMGDYTYSGITYMYSGAESADKITFHPIITLPEVIQVGQDLTISVTGQYNTLSYMYEYISGPVTVDLADVSVEYNGKTYVTDSGGLVTIPGQEVVAGEFILRFTKDLPGTIHSEKGNKELDSFPRIIRTYKAITVQEISGEDTGEIPTVPSNPEESTNPGGESKPSEQEDFRALAKQAIEKGKKYLVTNKKLVSDRTNESHSGYWMLSAMYALGTNISQFPWTTSPTTKGTYWTIPLGEGTSNGNELLGTVIGANLLGLDATNIKNRNFVDDLLANKNAAGMYTTLYGEPWAMVAWTLQNSHRYDLANHLKIPAMMQSATNGYIGAIDLTGWWLIALAPYRDQPGIEKIIQKAVAGYHAEFKQNGFEDNSNTMAAIISGLASVGEDLFSEKWTYEKDGQKINIVGYLVENYLLEDGGVRWKAADTKSNLMALEQVYIALADAVHQKSTFVRLKEDLQTQQPVSPTLPSEDDKNDEGNDSNQPEQPTTPVTPVNGSVTMSIVISSSEVVLPSAQFDIQSNETAFDILKRVTQQKQISLNYRQTSMGAYVVGIANVNEFDRGNLSGWMYSVNGVFPEVSADSYVVISGDRIEWLYTSDLGKDIGGNSENSTGTGSAKGEAPTVETDKKNVVIAQPGSGTEKTAIIEANKNVEQLEAKITAEMITEQIKQDVKKIVIQDSEGVKVELPTASLKLTAGEKLVVAVNQQVDTKVIKVNVAVVTQDGATKSLDVAKGYIKVTIPAPDTTANTVVLQLVDGEYRAVPHKVMNGEIVLLVKSSGEFIVSEEKVTFSDILKLANKDDIEFLASRHVIKGKDAENFAPNAPITRGQFAVMISRALGLRAVEEDGQFKDTAGKWYASDIQALFEAGITTGKTADTFDPEAGMTRGQGAAFMARILTYVNYQAPNTNKLSFVDAEKISKQYQESIALLQSLDIMSGKEDGTFDESGTLTRAQMAKILKRTLIEAGLM